MLIFIMEITVNCVLIEGEELKIENFVKVNTLGGGGQGEVVLVRANNGKQYAAKYFKTES